MNRTICSFVAITGMLFLGVSIASAQPQTSPDQVKGCARTLTDQMRNCGGQLPPQVREKSPSAGESAQGREEEETSCNQWALYEYYGCLFGGYGKTKPVPVVPSTGSLNKQKSVPTVSAKKSASPVVTK